jgi:hypothetical protein
METLLKNISDDIAFYEGISESTFSMIDTIYLPQNVGSVIFSAITNRLKTLRFAVKNGFISDSYVLIRMIYEDIFTFIYFEIKMGNGREDNDIRQWIQGKKKLHRLYMPQLLSFLVRNNHDIKTCFDLLDVSGKYKDIKSYCNDYVHNNYFFNLRLNADGYKDNVAQAHYERMASYLDALKILLFVAICILKPYYMSSSDYMDHLELGLSPPEGSQYWVAPFMQEEFDKIHSINKEVAEIILKSSYMKFEVKPEIESK